MHRSYLLCFTLLLLAGVGNAQTTYNRKWKNDTGSLFLRANLLGLADLYDMNFSLGAEYRFNNKWSVTMDAGYIFYSYYMMLSKRTNGILLRPGIRFYPGKYRNTFIELQGHYKGVRYHVNDWLGKDVVNNVPTYEEKKMFQYQKRVIGGHIMIGERDFISRDHRLFLEGYIGIGLHYKEESLYHEPNSQYENNMVTLRRVTSEKVTHVLPALPCGVRLVYTLR
jgi:hypothetical protein